MNSPIKQEDFERIFKQHLKIETYSKSIDSLFSPRLKSKINYKPYYQRNYVWDNNKATYFIESILLGTEIPPLIFFNNNTDIEVIDGRQRFETIMRFMENKFALSAKGLSILTQLKKNSFDDLAKKDKKIIETFLDAKIRIIEFALVNEPPLDKFLEDRVKKEIFSRYNTGITPLKKSEIDNAIYDDDEFSTALKNVLKSNKQLHLEIYNTFFKTKSGLEKEPKLEQTLSFIRRFLVLPKFPISSFARGHGRTDTLSKLYEYFSDTIVDESKVIKDFVFKLNFISKIKEYSDRNELKSNRLALECFLWGMSVSESEDVHIKYDENSIKEISEFISANIDFYIEQDSHYYKQVTERYGKTAEFFQNKYHIKLSVYLNAGSKYKSVNGKSKSQNDTIKKLSELESLRLNKPEPARNSIEDIRRVMQRRRFLVRPSYQRSEVINITKASSIIESILLGIVLPPIFIYKRDDGVNEVIDGQQRLLTILGYIGSEYIDENEDTILSKNHKFGIRKPRILSEITGAKFDHLPEDQRNKILDFQLYVVEIEEAKNPNFDPVDLFIRLNDKPYPIREHSFEMWNSWVDFEVIEQIRQVVKRNYSWFHIKQILKLKDRDRMENEELITALSAINYFDRIKDKRKYLYIYQKEDRINAMFGDKSYVSQLFSEVTENDKKKSDFLASLKEIESFIKKLKYVVLDANKSKDELFEYLRSELDILFRGDREVKYQRRTMQDFYIAWFLLNDINFEMVKHHRLAIKKELKSMYTFIKELPKELHNDNKGYDAFIQLSKDFKDRYSKDSRKLKFTEADKLALIEKQGNLSGLSDAPIFLGDDIEPDHTLPLAIGGKDVIENIKIAHKDENRSKGAKNNTYL
ncbi:MAG: DUF262 domain-containing protein [Ferruginibacter sp.]